MHSPTSRIIIFNVLQNILSQNRYTIHLLKNQIIY
nr:MAG TPA: hypothetical protein [Caudoviricetes sp.]